MKVISLVSNSILELAANTYLLVDENKDCVIIDPSQSDSSLLNYLKDNDFHPLAILLTHGHYDHIRGVDVLVDYYHIPVYISKKDIELLKNPTLNCSDRFSRKNIIMNSPVIGVDENDMLKILSEDILVIATPYHTEGSICFYLKDSGLLFSGDSLFKESVGRSDFPTSNPLLMDASLSKLMKLPKETKVYPGHNEETTIEHEQKLNSFVKR